MDVVLFAFCPSAAVYVDRLCAEDAALRLVVTSPSAAAGAVGDACRRLGVALEVALDVNAPDLVGRLAALRADLLLVAGCPRILGREIRATARLGAVNLHPSLLPLYRGREPLFWAILRGEPEVGITMHHLTDEVDGGPILFQRALAVPPRATSASLAREVDELGAGLVPELLRAATSFLPPGRPQLGVSTHFPPLRPEHGSIDWPRSAIEIDRLVRACAGEIHAYTSFQKMKVVVLEAEPSPLPVGARPGQVVSVSERELVVAACDGAVALRRFLFMDRRHDGAQLAGELRIRQGDSFGD